MPDATYQEHFSKKRELLSSENVNVENFSLLSFNNISEIESEMIRKWRNDENVRKWMYTDHIISESEHRLFMISLAENKNNIYWLVKNNNSATDEYLGVLSFNRIDFKNKNSYFGMYANPDIKKMGIGITLDKIAIQMAFEEMKLHTLKLEVIEENKFVILLHKKTGFQEEGILKEFVYKNDKWKNVVIMGITNQ